MSVIQGTGDVKGTRGVKGATVVEETKVIKGTRAVRGIQKVKVKMIIMSLRRRESWIGEGNHMCRNFRSSILLSDESFNDGQFCRSWQGSTLFLLAFDLIFVWLAVLTFVGRKCGNHFNSGPKVM